jgi:subtilisin family serine protease
VTGIAGLLLSFDPDLTPAQLKGLIVEGARKGGRSMPNDPTKYLANAYESLKLAAQRNPRTPICGFPVSLNGPAGAQYVKFE